MMLLGRRAFLRALTGMLAFGAAGCARSSEPAPEDNKDKPEEVQPSDEEQLQQQEASMQITVTVNDTPFVATIEDTAAGQELLARLPLTLTMEELHGNEKYCYTGKAFGGESYVPDTIESGDLMVFGSDCLVLFYETFANGGWGYARVGKIDDPSGLADACGSGTAMVAFEQIS